MNKYVVSLLVFIAAIAIGCTASRIAPGLPATSSVVDATSSGRMLYVTDGNSLNVYSVQTRSLIRSQDLGTTGWGVAVNSNGSVYVAEYGANKVVVFNDGAVAQIAEMTVSKPIGITIDSNDDLFVGSGGASVYEFKPNGARGQSPSCLPGRAVWGVSAKGPNDILEDVDDGAGSSVFEVNGGVCSNTYVRGSTPAGVAFFSPDDLYVAATNYLSAYNLALPIGDRIKPIRRVTYPGQFNTKLASSLPNGTVCVPVLGLHGSQSFVQVITAGSIRPPVNFPATSPEGCAEGT